MRTASLLSGRWSAIVQRIAEVIDIEATARTDRALIRTRKIRTAEALLRLALIYGPGQQSLRGAAVLAGDAGIAELSDKAVEGRLRRMGDWLAHILERLLAQRLGSMAEESTALGVSLVDGSVICAPGTGGKWRLHARYDPGRGRFVDLKLTSAAVAERVEHTRIDAGRVVVMDRGYARVRDFQAVLEAGSDFITRIGWRAVRLQDGAGQPVEVIKLLPEDDAPHDHDVWIKSIAQPLRLVIQRLPVEKAERARRKRARKASKSGARLDPRTAQSAGYVILLTSLPRAHEPAGAVTACYRNRWQVEIGFKRMKTLGGIDKLPSAEPRLARTWLLAHLIAAVLTDDLANEIVGFPPSER